MPADANGLSGGALLERAHELALIDDAIEAARGGTGALVLVQGDHGIGKTRLLAAFRERARDGEIHVLNARASDLEQEFAFGVVRQLLEPHLAAVADDERDALLGGPARHVAAMLGYESSASDGATAPGAGYETLHGLYRLCAGVAEAGGLLVCVDDVQWADGPSLRFIDYLAGRLEELAVLIVLAGDASEPGAETDVLPALAASPLAQVVRPAALSEPAVRELIGEQLAGVAVADADALAEACHRATGGNPFLLSELLAALPAADGDGAPVASADAVREIGPPTVASAVLRRLQRHSPHAVALAQAVAVLDTRAELRDAAALADLDEATAADTAGALVDMKVLQPGVPPRFVAPVVRAALYEDIATAARARGHDRAARLLAADGAPGADVAGHLVHTPPASDGWVRGTLQQAGAQALADGSPDAAVAYLQRALAESARRDRAGLLADLGRAELRLSHPVAAAEHLSAALEQIDDPPQRAAIGLELARALVTAGRCQDAAGLLHGLIAELEDGDCAAHPRLDAELLATTRLGRRSRSLVDRRLWRLHASADKEASAQRVLLATVAFEAAAVEGSDARGAAELARRALAGGALLEQESSESLHYYLAVWTLALCDHLELADRALRAAIASAGSHGSRLGFAAASCFHAAALARRGRLTEADAVGARALDAAQEGWRVGLPLAAAFRADVLIERDEPSAAKELIDAIGAVRSIPGSAGYDLVRYQRGRVRIALGALEEGLEDLMDSSATEPVRHVRGLPVGAWHAEVALVLTRLDRLDEAQHVADEGLELARTFGAPSAVATALRTAGLIAGGVRGVEQIAQAAGLLRRSPVKLERARTLVELGAAMRRANGRSAARKELHTGLDLAERCGAIALAKRARTELQATGARPRRPLRKGLDALTASERRVAEMAARGLSNRGIAQELFVTVKTVEWHLGQAYRKLDVRSRVDLPAVFAAARDRTPGHDAGVHARVAPDAN